MFSVFLVAFFCHPLLNSVIHPKICSSGVSRADLEMGKSRTTSYNTMFDFSTTTWCFWPCPSCGPMQSDFVFFLAEMLPSQLLLVLYLSSWLFLFKHESCACPDWTALFFFLRPFCQLSISFWFVILSSQQTVSSSCSVLLRGTTVVIIDHEHIWAVN